MTADMSDDELLALIGQDPADIIVCGGSHVPFYRQVDDLHVVNVGSVGEAPSGRVAHATLIDANAQGVMVEQFEVPY
jgi:predicted phosphodiesterase